MRSAHPIEGSGRNSFENAPWPTALRDACGIGLLATLATLVFFTLYARAMGEPWTLGGDNEINQFPLSFEAYQGWREGRIPEWSTRIWSGYPVLADLNGGPLYPPLLLSFALTAPPHLFAYDLATALHAGIFAAGGTFLLQLLGTGRFAAAFGGTLLLLAPFSHQWATHLLPHYSALAFWPWLLASAEMMRRPSISPVGGFAWLGWGSLASQVLAGYPEFAFYSGLIAGLWIIARGRPEPLGGRVVAATILGLGGLALAAPQLLATANVLGQSMRGVAPNPLLAQVLSLPWNTWMLPPAGEAVRTALFPTFLGYTCIVLAAVALVQRRPAAWLLGAVGGAAFLLSLGPRTPLYPALHSLPVFAIFRGPMKFWQVTELAVTLLAALGADSLLRQTTSKRTTTVGLIALLLIGGALAERVVFTTLRFQHYARIREEMPTRPMGFIRDIEESGLLEKTRGVHQNRTLFAAHPELFFGSMNVIFGVDSLRGGPAQLLGRDHGRALGAAGRDGLLNLAGVRFVLATTDLCADFAKAPDWEITEVTPKSCILEATAPRARYELLSEAVSVRSAGEGTARMRADATLPIGVVLDPSHLDLLQGAQGRADIVTEGPGYARLDISTDRAGLLLVRESWTPGWSATVDGITAPIYQAAGPFFAVELPSGQHRVELTYRARGFRSGLAIALAWTLLAVTAAAWRRRSRSP